MKTHIFEAQPGVTLRVEYDHPPAGLRFHSIRVLDVNYQPVGPDLKEFFHGLVQLGPPEPGSEVPSGERFLCKIAESIYYD